MIHYDLIFKDQIPISEILLSPGDGRMDFSYWGLLPFSRGNIHIQSNDSTTPAAINPNYFQLDYDLKQQIGTAKAVRKLAGSDALCEVVTGELSPGLQSVPLDASDEVWAKALKEGCKYSYFARKKQTQLLTRSIRSFKLPLHLHSSHDGSRPRRCSRYQSLGIWR